MDNFSEKGVSHLKLWDESDDKNQVWFLALWLLWPAANFSGRSPATFSPAP